MEAVFGAAHRPLKLGGILPTEGRLRPLDRLEKPVKRQGTIAQFRRIAREVKAAAA
jgi:hypothetical protein